MTLLLVFNRGEIALRACLAAQKLGMRTVLLVTPVDALSPAVRHADALYVESTVDPASAFKDLDVLRRALAATGATHVYPGYGFLSEAPELAQAVHDAGATFVGPNVDVLTLMAHKQRAQSFAEAAGLAHLGVNLTVSEQGVTTDAPFPILLKASAGGGGRGNLVVSRPEDLTDSYRKLQARALTLFGNADLLAERYLPEARHVELQVFGLCSRVISLGTRDCSLQRKHQKVVEEGPAQPRAVELLAPLLPRILGTLTSLGYRGAGTIELLFEPRSDALFFLEMNTRIQVEHTVSELLCGVDLVEWQLREASGIGADSLADEALAPRGHALEARIYAEDPHAGFVPDTGVLHHMHLPPMPFVRWDVGVEQGGHVSPYYDPMIAKVIVWGTTRAQAIERLAHALAHTQIHGAKTNLEFLHKLVLAQRFRDDSHDTGFIEREFLPGLGASSPAPHAVEAGLLRDAPATGTAPKAHEGGLWKRHHRS